MFSDTHFHFKMLCGNDAEKGAAVLRQMCSSEAFFGLDIGTKCADLAERQTFAAAAISALPQELRGSAEKLLHFSAGIWPAAEAIRNRGAELAALRRSMEEACGQKTVRNSRVVAVGECGLDHHWNQADSDFGCDLLQGEAEMFEAQLELARELELPVVIHSRDAFEDTYACIRNVGYDRGIIHCFSYGEREARAFAERGWHISFSGSVTYAKKSKLAEIERTVRCVPLDQILLETDSPYLAPVPLRGQKNTPLNVRHTYEYVAQILGIAIEELCAIVDKNCRNLFNIEAAVQPNQAGRSAEIQLELH